jgi:hypothetical protein
MVVLGEVELPSGVMLVLDPGLGRFWRHDGEPRSPRASDPATVDLAVLGPDAEAAGSGFDHSFVPQRIYDVGNVDKLTQQFATYCKKHNYQARLEPLPAKVPHLERARLALEHGRGLGVVEFNRVWGVVIGGLPAGQSLSVVGEVLSGEFAGRYRSIDVVVDDAAAVARTQSVMGVMVEHGQLLCTGLEPFGAFKMWEPPDGLADFVFWGQDAAALAQEFGAHPLGEGNYGWCDLPIATVGDVAQPLQQRVAHKGLKVTVDYRPHDNLEKLNAQIRAAELRAGSVILDGARACGCDNRWGDGVFSVARDLDRDGRVIRVRFDVGNEETQARTRRVMSCMVSKHLLDEDAMPAFAAREEPEGWYNGWIFFSGHPDESLPDFGDDPDNWCAMPLHQLIKRFPIIDAIVDTPPDCEFELDGNASHFHRVDET